MTAPNDVHISVVIPFYKGEECLDELYTRLCEALTPVSPHFEIVLVDDASPDDGWKKIEALAGRDPRVRGVQLSRNFGQHHAITAGLSLSRGAWCVVMDCDLQDRPEEIPRLYAKAQEGYDCVLARRAARNDAALKQIGSRMFYRVFNYLTELRYDGSVANFSIISRAVVDELNRMGEAVRFYGGFLYWVGFRKCFLDVQHDARPRGSSSYTFLKLVLMALNVILTFSAKPLRICLNAGFLLGLLSLFAGLFLVVYKLLHGDQVQLGWASVIVSIYLSTGAIIFTLGVLGLYVERIFNEVKRRPVFVVRETTFPRTASAQSHPAAPSPLPTEAA